ncbi:MAG: cyclase family protein [Bacteroidetes bacterium SB0662_bin_6]|nr:cyclase family protein [Bacteroidetes bacterium SB0668_bin_1]MYE05054.1 cyclase family protein [Bacteroidetes bacterium SB0662_bin_6]
MPRRTRRTHSSSFKAKAALATVRGKGALATLTTALLAAGCLQDAPPPDHTAVFTGDAGEWVELSHAFGPSTIYWPTDTVGFQLTELAYGYTDAGFFYASYSFASAEHGGTHLDAPIHFAEGRMTADEIPLSSLITCAR